MADQTDIVAWASLGASAVAIVISVVATKISARTYRDSQPDIKISGWIENYYRELRLPDRTVPDVQITIRIVNRSNGAIEIDDIWLKLPEYDNIGPAIEPDERYIHPDDQRLPYLLAGRTTRTWKFDMSRQLMELGPKYTALTPPGSLRSKFPRWAERRIANRGIEINVRMGTGESMKGKFNFFPHMLGKLDRLFQASYSAERERTAGPETHDRDLDDGRSN